MSFLGQNWSFDPLVTPNQSFPKHAIYTVWKVIAWPYFMQNFKKFWGVVLEKFYKISILGQNWSFDPLVTPNQSFPEHAIYTDWKVITWPYFMQNFKKFWGAVSEKFNKLSIFGPKLTFWPPWREVKSFFQKSKNVIFLQLSRCNFAQKIKNI